jgi:hypothetical protein
LGSHQLSQCSSTHHRHITPQVVPVVLLLLIFVADWSALTPVHEFAVNLRTGAPTFQQQHAAHTAAAPAGG